MPRRIVERQPDLIDQLNEIAGPSVHDTVSPARLAENQRRATELAAYFGRVASADADLAKEIATYDDGGK